MESATKLMPDSKMEAEASEPSLADELVEELMPEGFDWVRIVRTYPLTSLAVAVLGGFVLGRRHGTLIVDSVSEFAGDHLAKSVQGLLDLDGDSAPP